MASPNIYSSGFNFAGTVFYGGPSVAQLMPAYVSGGVQWLDTIGGNNSNSGATPELPVKTFAQALTNSTANGLIIIGQGSSENIASNINATLAGLTVWGCGSGSSIPRYTMAVASGAMITAAGGGQRWRNIRFGAPTSAASQHIDATATRVEIRDCYFECSTNGGGVLADTGASGLRVRGCSFVSTGTIPSTGYLNNAALTDLAIEDTTFDGSTLGWSNYALLFSTNASTRIYLENVQLRNRSDFGVTVTGTSYQNFGVISDGTSRVVLAA